MTTFIRFLSSLSILLLLASPALAGATQNPFAPHLQLVTTIEEVDGSPSVPIITKIIVTNDTVTDNGDGSVTLDLTGTGGAVEGTAVLSTEEGGATKFLREDGDGTSSWQTATAGHADTITWTGTSVLETGVAFQFGDLTDTTITHTYGTTGTPVTIAYSTAAMAITGAVTGTSFGGITEANLVDKTAAESITGDVWNFAPLATGANDAFDATFGDDTNDDYGAIQIGNAGLYSSSFSASALNLDKAFLFRQIGNIGVGNDPGIEFAWMEKGNTVRMAIPESAVGNATAMIRSVTIAGPYSAAVGNAVVTCNQWSTYDSNIDCDTSGTGADLFVQDDLEVEGEIYLSGSIFGDADDASQHQIVFANATGDHILTIPDDTIAAGDVIFGTGAGTFGYDATPAINCTDCTNIPEDSSHNDTVTWSGTAILESGAAFQFGDGTDATLTHTYANTGTDVSIAYSTGAMAVTGALSATNLSGTNTGDDDVPESGDFAGAGDLDADGTITDGVIDDADHTADSISHTSMVDSDQECGGDIWFEDPVDADDFKSIWANKGANACQITEIWAESDQTVTFMLQVDDGSPADCDSVDLAPAAGEAEDTSLDGDCLVSAGEELDLDLVSVGSTPTWVAIKWTGNWVD